MKLTKETEQDIAQLQAYEQNLQQFLAQRQTLQMQQLEIEHALGEIAATKDAPFKVIGNVMVVTTKEKLQEELTSKKERTALRITTIESQEAKIKEKAEALQQSIVRILRKEEGSHEKSTRDRGNIKRD